MAWSEIRVLDAETIGQIAAGEVIERPLSVVKELVENALDAGATRIAVRVRAGGLGEIEVADDGSGIEREELPYALRRHATSKLVAAPDLGRIGTLGFRGEGLASIAAVARIQIISRTREHEIASSIEGHGETIGPVVPFAGPPGTRVIVRDLFANVPVRREYLRSPGAEFGRIASWLATLTLAYPDVGFTLEHDGKPVFAFAPGDDGAPRLQHVFGADPRTMLRLEDEGSDPHAVVGGWISSPGDDRPDRRAQVLFVNGRLLRSTLAGGAWSAAYRTFAMSGRHPYGVLYLTIPTDEVDPNVHPTKSDVRLRYADHVLARVRGAMIGALRRGAVERLERAISFAPPVAAAAVLDEGALPDAVPETSWVAPLVDASAEAPELRVLAQVDRTFVLATDGTAVVLVDQHAAHERIVFEQLMENAAHDAPSEPLLIPHVFEVDGADADRLEAARDALARAGLHVEPFGERAFRVTATPAHLTHAGKTRTFDFAEFLACLADDAPGLDREQRVWASLACHSVARAGDALTPDEMTTLLARLRRTANPMHCPHGRPTIVRLEPNDLAKLFRRI